MSSLTAPNVLPGSLGAAGGRESTLPEGYEWLDSPNLTPEERAEALARIQSIMLGWFPSARESQRPPSPEDWKTWLVLAGRGFGKTRTGAEWVVENARRVSELRAAIVGATYKDVRITMVEGESGILEVLDRRKIRHKYNRSNGEIFLTHNKSVIFGFTSEEPQRLRGPQHHIYWADELAAWVKLDDTWSNLQLGLRLGDNPRGIVTTTPQPLRMLRSLVHSDDTKVTRGSTLDNTENLPKGYIDQILKLYDGTDLGRQEIYGELLDDETGLLFSSANIQFWTPQLLAEGEVMNCEGDIVRLAECEVFMTVDVAATVKNWSDYTVVSTWALSPEGYLILLDASRRRVTEGQHHILVMDHVNRFRPEWVGVEKSAYSTTLLIDLTRHLPTGTSLRQLVPDGDKALRALPAARIVADRQFFLPKDFRLNDTFVEEMLEFPAGPHDDFVDTLSYAGIHVSRAPKGARRRADVPSEHHERLNHYLAKRQRQLRRRKARRY